jgi:hypothetical protein
LTASGPPDCVVRDTGAGHEIVRFGDGGGGGVGGEGAEGGGGAVTVMLNEQESARLSASVDVQLTGVVPTENLDPLCGAHVVAIGCSPASVMGAS